MSQTILISISFLTSAWLIPLVAQDQLDDLRTLNFNIGGGLSVPINPTASFVGVSGNFATGVGANFNQHNSIEGDFMWSGLSPSLAIVRPVNAPFGSVNLYTLTGNYRFHIDSIADSPFGVYIIGGGGWYYRHVSISKKFIVPPLTVCQPIYLWWGYACETGTGFVATETLASHGTSAGGLNAGVGFTVKIGDLGWKFFVESRYSYAASNFIPTTLVPVTFGFRFN